MMPLYTPFYETFLVNLEMFTTPWMTEQREDYSINLFNLSADMAYAGTSRSEWEAIARQLTFLKQVDLEDLEPEDRTCEICREPYVPLNDNGCHEKPVSLPCGHVFGYDCLEEWMVVGNDHDPVEYEDSPDEPPAREGDQTYSLDGVEDLLPDSAFLEVEETFTCPKCRESFTVPMSAEKAPALEARLRFWDSAYEKVGIIRSADEEDSRQDLWRFVLTSKPKVDANDTIIALSLRLRAQVAALRFVLRRLDHELTPLQRQLRREFFHLGCYGVNSTPATDVDADENRTIPLWCWAFDRIERRMSPDYNGFLDEWHQQRLGPWMRKLFREMEHGPFES